MVMLRQPFIILITLFLCKPLRHIPRDPKVSISQKKRLEVTSPAIVVLNAFLDSSDLPKEGLSGLLWNFFGVML